MNSPRDVCFNQCLTGLKIVGGINLLENNLIVKSLIISYHNFQNFELIMFWISSEYKVQVKISWNNGPPISYVHLLTSIKYIPKNVHVFIFFFIMSIEFENNMQRSF